MERLTKKQILKRLFHLSWILGLILLLVMNFSHDVEVLKTQYPHLKILKNELIEIEIKPNRPASWVKLRDISKYAKGAIVLSEDWGFYDHEGVDLEQMRVALSEMADGSRYRGASTITQQMVKNIFLSGYFTLWRKIHEIVLVRKVEQKLSKDKILEIYLNCIEYGPGLYGIKAAAKHYFKKTPGSLGPKESAFLAMLLPSPKKYYVSFKRKHLTKFAKSRIAAILKKMRMGKIITPEEYEAQLTLPLSWE